MAEGFSVRGGAQIGWVNAGWPLARLSVSPGSLVVSGPLVGTYALVPEQVVALEPYGWIPILHRGVRIVHANPIYPARIVFFTFQDPARLIERIRAAPFIPAAPARPTPARRGVPIRGSALLLLVLGWSALHALDGLLPGTRSPAARLAAALALLFIAASVLPGSPWLQSWVLRPGRTVGEIRPALMLVRLVAGFLLALLIAIAIAGPPQPLDGG
jgi:hypothetical protein